jgi:hypothetical protein
MTLTNDDGSYYIYYYTYNTDGTVTVKMILYATDGTSTTTTYTTTPVYTYNSSSKISTMIL